MCLTDFNHKINIDYTHFGAWFFLLFFWSNVCTKRRRFDWWKISDYKRYFSSFVNNGAENKSHILLDYVGFWKTKARIALLRNLMVSVKERSFSKSLIGSCGAFVLEIVLNDDAFITDWIEPRQFNKLLFFWCAFKRAQSFRERYTETSNSIRKLSRQLCLRGKSCLVF